MPGWILAIDFGTSSTAAARRVGDREVERIQLEGNPRMPSMVFWREGTGSGQTGRLVLGQEADELSSLAPWCLERAPKRRLGDEFMQLGEKQLRVVEVVGAILREVTNEALSLSGGEPPSEIRLTHPARWAKSRLDKLRQAARQAGIENPTFIPEPVAAATHFASERLAVGEHVAVYDLGGGTFDTAVLERTEDSFKVIGKPGGDEELGGEDFDDLLYRHLGEQLPGETWHQLRAADGRKERSWSQANRELLRHARRAKEGLSRSPQYEFYMPQPIDQELHAGAAELERLIAPTLRGTVAELERTILAAGLKPQELAAIYLAGGSSRIPLVGRLIQERLGVMAEHLDDPKAVIALGAARLAEESSQETVLAELPAKPALVPAPASEPEPPLPPAKPPREIPAAWYRNPTGPGSRYWDGRQWTERVRSGKEQAAGKQVQPSAPTFKNRMRRAHSDAGWAHPESPITWAKETTAKSEGESTASRMGAAAGGIAGALAWEAGLAIYWVCVGWLIVTWLALTERRDDAAGSSG